MARQSLLNPQQTFTYIQGMLTEMRILSENENAAMLAYLIEMAILEADDLAQGIHVSHPAPDGAGRKVSKLAETIV